MRAEQKNNLKNKAKTEKDLWNADLDDFVVGYQKYLAELETSEARDSHTAPGAGGNFIAGLLDKINSNKCIFRCRR